MALRLLGADALTQNWFHTNHGPSVGPNRNGLSVAALLWATSTLSVVTWQSPPPGTTAARTRFVDVAATAGVTFVHRHSPTADKHYPESVPGGVAVFDYNGDGRPDIFFTNGAEMPTLVKRGDGFANRLYRNDGGMKFTDVTAAAGVSGIGYAMGAAAADYDNDGHVDLFVAGVARNQLLHNRGDGSFEDVTERARIGSGEWAAAGGWFDYDRDGRLDLLVVNYVRWSAQGGRFCGDQAKGVRIYCHPRYFEGLPNRLYRNRGDGTFEDVSAQTGIAKSRRQGHERRVRRLRPRWRHGRFRHQRHGPELPLSQQRRWHVHRRRPHRRRRTPGIRPPDLRHGRRLPGLRQRRLGGHPSYRHFRRDLPALPQRLAHAAPAPSARPPPRAGSDG